MVPGISQKGITANPVSLACHNLIEGFLYQNHSQQDQQRIGRWPVGGRSMSHGSELSDACMGNSSPRYGQDQRPYQ